MTLRGIELAAAVTLIAELGDLTRFAHPKQPMAFLGSTEGMHTASRARFGASPKPATGTPVAF